MQQQLLAYGITLHAQQEAVFHGSIPQNDIKDSRYRNIQSVQWCRGADHVLNQENSSQLADLQDNRTGVLYNWKLQLTRADHTSVLRRRTLQTAAQKGVSIVGHASLVMNSCEASASSSASLIFSAVRSDSCQCQVLRLLLLHHVIDQGVLQTGW